MSPHPLSQRDAAAADPTAPLDDAPPPEDPRFRVMRRLVNALLVVMIVGVLTIVTALVLALKRPAPGPAGADIPGLTAGERILEARATNTRITLLIEDPQGARRVVILDARTFRPVSSLRAPQ